jgi:ribonuclease HI
LAFCASSMPSATCLCPWLFPEQQAHELSVMAERKQVTIWTDGACLSNPGPGGYAAVLTCGEHRREISGGYRLTTNNRMELMAVIAALELLKYPCDVIIRSDARYVVDGVMKGAMRRWRAAGWRRQHGAIPNADLWARLSELCERHNVSLEWIRGHSGISENERCDQLALQAAQAAELPTDLGYEQPTLHQPVEATLFDGLD